MSGDIADWTCLVGTLSQEVYDSSDKIHAACEASIFGHADTLTSDFQAAFDTLPSPPDFCAKSYALHTQAVLLGAFILAKASGDETVAYASVDHLKRYIQLTFAPSGDSVP